MTRYYNLKPHAKLVQRWKEIRHLPDVVNNGFDKIQGQLLATIGDAQTETLTDPDSVDMAHPRTEVYVHYAEEAAGRPISREISHFYRDKDRKGNEYVFWKQKLRGINYDKDKEYQIQQLVGRYEYPIYAINARTKMVTGVADGNHTEYEIPYTTGEFTDPSTGEKTTFEALQKYFTEKMWFYVFINNVKWELLNVTFDEYITRPHDDLVFHAKNGRWPEQPAPAVEATVKPGKGRGLPVKAVK